jgi:hypothetical protein
MSVKNPYLTPGKHGRPSHKRFPRKGTTAVVAGKTIVRPMSQVVFKPEDIAKK